jgi:hypothetical protein
MNSPTMMSGLSKNSFRFRANPCSQAAGLSPNALPSVD